MAEQWSTKVNGRTEDDALRLADERAAEHFAGRPYSRQGVQRLGDERDASGDVARWYAQVFYVCETD